MQGTLVILKKELSSIFLSPLFYFLAFVMTALLGVIFAIQLDKFAYMASNAMMQFGVTPQQQNIHYALFLQHLSLVNMLLIFIIPALCMRLIAEEKKNRTFDLLLTSPINSFAIVMGKFLSMIVVIFGLVLISLVYPLITSQMAEFSWGPTLVAALGIFLVGAVYAAMNLFASSLTDNALIAFVLSIVFNLGLWFVGALNDSFDAPTAKKILEHISLNTHLSGMIEGTIRTNGIIFLLSLVFLFCFLTERVVESARWRA